MLQFDQKNEKDGSRPLGHRQRWDLSPLRDLAVIQKLSQFTGSDVATFRLFLDFDVDQQLLGRDRQNKPLFWDVSIMNLISRSVILHCHDKGHRDERIDTKMVAIDGRNGCTEDSVKH
jgi:hypothetical protein